LNQEWQVVIMRFGNWIVVSSLLVAAGCIGNVSSLVKMSPAVPGSGVAKEESRPVEAFHAIEAGNALQVTVTVTKGAKPSLDIKGDDNLVPLVVSEIHEGKLTLRIKDNSNIRTKLPLEVTVVTDVLDEAIASGAATVKVKGDAKVDKFTAGASGAARLSVDGLETPKAIASASGASQVILSGTAESLDVVAAGASEIKAAELKVDDASVSISGASGSAVRASKSVAGDVSGASHLDLHGQPAKKAVATSGASNVNVKG
jgi:hypothetical protein